MPIRRIEGATPAPVIYVNGKPVTLWNYGTTADGVNLTVKTIRPICEAINDGYDDLSGWCDSLSSKLDTVSSNLDIVSGDLDVEIERSTNEDRELQSQIDRLKAATDVIMVYGTYSAFSANSASPSLGLTDADVIKVLYDETSNSEQVYYQWYDPASGHEWSGWSGIGSLAPYYSKSEINNNFLSAKSAVSGSKNIAITEDPSHPKITIATKDNVEFTNVSSTTFSGINIYGSTKNTTIDGLIGSAQSAYNVINSAVVSGYNGTTPNTAYLSGGFAIKAGDNLTLTYADKTFTLNAGDTGITAISAGNTQYTGPVFSASAGTGINFVNDSNNVLGIKASNSLINSATGGSAAYNLLTGQSATLYPGPGIQFYSAAENKLGIKVSAQGIGGTITSIAGSALSAGANYTNGRYIEIGSDNSINLSSNIIIDYMSATSALLSAIYGNGYYYNYLTPSSTRFTFGYGAATISLTGVELTDNQSTKYIPWTKLTNDFVLTTGNASGSKLSANTAITLVVTSQLPGVLEANTYYIV